ncbi:OpgC domain-containing protein [Sphingobium boeckii]|uniref:Acyltransferase n=1 Tax=Sphingobium boeckii TaxID=1082345 RepID=A0A7W9AHG0_9SPHN|nr:OpgC domain-containing protein [Sphingobium boeckii]MBB5685762.1 hypothetical protein [Sphingobium boeckii]
MSETKVTERDLRIDFLRGFFIVSLSATHYTWFASVAGYGSIARFYDMQPFGFSSPAEFFVFFSGYVLTLVLGRNYDKVGFWLTQARTLDRAWSLYVLNVFTLAIIAGSAAFLFANAPGLAAVSKTDRFLADPAGFLFQFLTFQTNFAFFEILRNYIFFIPLVAIFLKLSRIHAALPLGISFAVWAVYQLGLIPGFHYVTFNPLGWQFLFFLGGGVALIKPLTQWTFPRRGLQIAACLGLIALAFAFKMLVFPGIQAESIPHAQKVSVGPLRVLHFLLILWTAMLITPASNVLRRSRIVMSVVAVGQNSLECFCLTNILVYFGAHLLSEDPASVPRYFAILLGVVTLVLLGGRMFGWFKSAPWVKRAKAAA